MHADADTIDILAPPLLTYSPLDSARFSLKIYRGQAASVPDVRLLAREIFRRRCDVTIMRVPAGEGRQLERLRRHGIAVLHADTLAYYAVDLTSYQPRGLRNSDLVLELARPEDRPDVRALVESTFAGYSSHYHSNPHLQVERILAGYMEWADGYIEDGQAGRSLWVARRDGVLIAFACCSHDRSLSRCEGVLYGVHPEHAGSGVYGDLIRHTQRVYRELGYQTMEVSTQIWNLAVQKVWAREGFTLTRVYDTMHLNALLSGGETVVDRPLRFSADDVSRFAAVSGDANPIHLDDESARRCGFAGRISHGMLAGSELSRVFGMEVPGPGTLFLRNEMAFLSPVHADCDYRLLIRLFPSRGRHVLAVATIEQEGGEVCLLSTSDLMRPG